MLRATVTQAMEIVRGDTPGRGATTCGLNWSGRNGRRHPVGWGVAAASSAAECIRGSGQRNLSARCGEQLLRFRHDGAIGRGLGRARAVGVTCQHTRPRRDQHGLDRSGRPVAGGRLRNRGRMPTMTFRRGCVLYRIAVAGVWRCWGTVWERSKSFTPSRCCRRRESLGLIAVSPPRLSYSRFLLGHNAAAFKQSLAEARSTD